MDRLDKNCLYLFPFLYGPGKFSGIGKQGKGNYMLSPQELLELLRSSDHSRVVDVAGSSVISDQELDALLDRSGLHHSTSGSDLFRVSNLQNREPGLRLLDS